MSERQKTFTINNKIGVLGHIKVYYGCYETTKNGSLHTFIVMTR
jgi:hypothetical protein